MNLYILPVHVFISRFDTEQNQSYFGWVKTAFKHSLRTILELSLAYLQYHNISTNCNNQYVIQHPISYFPSWTQTVPNRGSSGKAFIFTLPVNATSVWKRVLVQSHSFQIVYYSHNHFHTNLSRYSRFWYGRFCTWPHLQTEVKNDAAMTFVEEY